jgi:hypothetical protein
MQWIDIFLRRRLLDRSDTATTRFRRAAAAPASHEGNSQQHCCSTARDRSPPIGGASISKPWLS